MREFSQALSAFADAESAGRAAAVAATREQAKAPVVVANVPPPQALPAQPASNPSAEIAAVVAQYARAIEARDVGEMRRLYPGMSSDQASSFDVFFKSLRSIRAALSLSNLQVDGSSADAKLNGIIF